jgi:hypothetical protein
VKSEVSSSTAITNLWRYHSGLTIVSARGTRLGHFPYAHFRPNMPARDGASSRIRRYESVSQSESCRNNQFLYCPPLKGNVSD